MIKSIFARLQQGHRTGRFPYEQPILPDRFRGLPIIDHGRCAKGCRACAEACPTGAIKAGDGSLRLDLGRCLFCTECVDACPDGAIEFTQDYRLACAKRSELELRSPPAAPTTDRVLVLTKELRRLFGRSLKLRVVSAGGCNACEADVNVLQTIVFDLGRFGIQYVASPRHADGLLITGPVTENMRLALKKTYDAVPNPKIVIAVGACAISGGPYVDHPEVHNGADSVVPVDLYVPGCPPHPYTILEGLLGLIGRARSREERARRITATELAIHDEQLEAGLEHADHAVRALGATLPSATTERPPTPSTPGAPGNARSTDKN
jgi:Ni,Fe-hydrogenase III small subunit/NAD-dependent dihydropyrimidine dehydrogenase PreA subunit